MPHDARRVKVSLTAKSRRIAQRLIPQIEQRYQELEESLGLQSMQVVYDALDALLSRAPSPAGLLAEESAGADANG
jgi:DNA-binding MarR family transcriptional regulator